MGVFLCKNCGQPLKAIWSDEEGYYPMHYGPTCGDPQFEPEDAEILDNDYAE